MAEEEKTKFPNVRALRAFRMKGRKDDAARTVAVGEVVAKADFNDKGDWMNLCNMRPPKAEQTDEKVGKPSKGKAADLPGA